MSDFYKFRPIPGVDGGYAALKIYKPGSFFGRDGQHAVMVGGCGYGHRKTLEEAKALLLECAKEYCQRRIEEARRETEHYEEQLRVLRDDGLIAVEKDRG